MCVHVQMYVCTVHMCASVCVGRVIVLLPAAVHAVSLTALKKNKKTKTKHPSIDEHIFTQKQIADFFYSPKLNLSS